MSTKSCDVKKPIIIKKMPMILKKEHLILQSEPKTRPLVKIHQPLFKEDVIYESRNGDFLKDVYSKITLVNRLNLRTNCSRTVARCITREGLAIEKCSVNVAKVISQVNYDTVFSALCSVISQELKVRGILALLTVSKSTKEAATQTEDSKFTQKYNTNNSSCQTEESSMNIFFKTKERKRVKRPALLPYVVQDTEKKIKKVIVNPENFKQFEEGIFNLRDLKQCDGNNLMNFKKSESLTSCIEIKTEYEEKNSTDHIIENHNNLPTVEHNIDDNSMDSIGNYSNLSVKTSDSIFSNLLFENVDKFTKSVGAIDTDPVSFTNMDTSLNVHSNFKIKMKDGTELLLPSEPEDHFHIATKENLEYVGPENERKLMLHQSYIHWKYCLVRDEHDNLPIHNAVLSNDLELLRWQCFALNYRNESVDIPANENWTALKMAVFGDNVECVTLLLHFGADPLIADEDNKTLMHFAAESSSELLRTFIGYCKQNPGRILEDYEELWKAHFDDLSKPDVLAKHLLAYMCTRCDSQGYTPLMLASKLGKHDNVRQLVEVAPHVVNKQMPTCGNTALYLAVGAACTDANERGNRSKVDDNFRQTIEILVENGADPSIDNNSGSNVNVLLTEFNIGELSMLIANKLSSVRCFDESSVDATPTNLASFMLIRNDDGTIVKDAAPKPVKPKHIEKKKPVIVQNILVSNVRTQKAKITTSVKPDNVCVVNMNNKSAGKGNRAKVAGRKVIVSKGEGLKNIKLSTGRTETVTSGKRKPGSVQEPLKNKQAKYEHNKT